MRREHIEGLQQQAEESAERLAVLEQAREESQVRVRDVTQRRADVQAQLGAKQERLQQMQVRGERLRRELQDLLGDLTRDEQESSAARARLEQALASTEGHDTQREKLLTQRDEHRRQLDEIRARARADREQRHQTSLKLETARAQLNATRDSLEKMRGQLNHLAHRRQELQAVLADGGAPIQTMSGELEGMLSQRLEVDEQLAVARRQVQDIEHSLREEAERRSQSERKVQDVRAQLEQARMACQEIRVRRQTMEEQLVEAGFELQQLRTDMPEGAEESVWHANVERVSNHIQRLGAINLAAIDEFKEQSERKGYLDAQYADLTEALTTLENAIRKIDKETKQRFQETFDKVNAGLQAMFPRLFGGGHAYMELTGEDLLETGVTIMARPPGKRNSTIHLLSGGEKALTAVAMVFSIFELNPAPFCMLDEVDAPLDDANVGRFSRMLEEMSDRVQFIFITHNKGTMEISKQLMGVTMHEPGVSRLVTVDVDEAVELAAAS